MASVKTLDVTENVFNDFVTGLPPRPNHVIPKFHNRSNLFQSTFANKLYENNCKKSNNRQVSSANPKLRQQEVILNDNDSETKYSSRKSVLRRRPVSAKARLESTSKPDLLSGGDNSCMMIIPADGKEVPVVDIGDQAPFPSYHYLFSSKEKYVPDETKPFLPGHTENRIPSLDHYQTSEIKKTDDSSSIKPVIHGLNSHQVLYGTDYIGEPQDIKYDLQPPVDKKPERSLPSTLEPLRPWLSENKDIPSVYGSDCLAFLPTLSDFNDLPEVPPPHSVHEDLPYTTKLQQPMATKKYHHPSFDKKHVEEWVCNHSRPGTACKTEHQNHLPRHRNTDDIREEIQELENLMQGLGNLDSACGMVKFQGEIDRFRQMYADTMKMVPERLLHSPKDADTFGVKQFLKQHVDIMNEIRRKHTLCLEELRMLEADSGMDSGRKYFKHRTLPPDI